MDCRPRDIRNLAEFFGKKREIDAALQQYSIQIIAEINHAPALPIDQLVTNARWLKDQGAGHHRSRLYTWHDLA